MCNTELAYVNEFDLIYCDYCADHCVEKLPFVQGRLGEPEVKFDGKKLSVVQKIYHERCVEVIWVNVVLNLYGFFIL